MAKVGCLCGAILSDVDCPSDNIIYIYRYYELESVLTQNANITLWNYYESTMENHLYWYCNKCGRVYKFPNGSEAKPDKIYRRETVTEEAHIMDMIEMVAFSDIEIDTITEDNPDICLKEFLDNRLCTESYFLDRSSGQVYVFDKENCKIIAKYCVEK